MSVDDFTRLLFIAACLTSAGVALWVRHREHEVWGWHCSFIAFWSVFAAYGMVGLTSFGRVFPGLDQAPVKALNVSSSATILGWVLLMWRTLRAATKRAE